MIKPMDRGNKKNSFKNSSQVLQLTTDKKRSQLLIVEDQEYKRLLTLQSSSEKYTKNSR